MLMALASPFITIYCVADSDLNGRAWSLWAESVLPDTKAASLSVRAKGYSEFKKGNINDADIIPMGIDCPTR